MKEIKILKERLNFARIDSWTALEWAFWLDHHIDKKRITESEWSEARALIDQRLDLLTDQMRKVYAIDPLAQSDVCATEICQTISFKIDSLGIMREKAEKCSDGNFRNLILTIVSQFEPLSDKLHTLKEITAQSCDSQKTAQPKQAQEPTQQKEGQSPKSRPRKAATKSSKK